MSRGSDPLDRLVHLVEGATDDDVRATTFVRGLALGALVGAAVAGSTIWQRRRHPGPDTETAPRTEAEKGRPGPSP